MENLYLIKSGQYYKIGIANDLKSRMAALQTGNPLPLGLVACFQFPNAGVVEKALHQAFDAVRKLGEWFELEYDINRFLTICRTLGGEEVTDNFKGRELVNDSDIGNAEEEQQIALDAPNAWDFAAMFSDGWRMNVQDSRRLYWNWRRGSDEKRETIYGGVVANLPYPIEDMRRIYRDGEKP